MAACARRAVQRRRDCCVCCETGLPKGGEEGLLLECGVFGSARMRGQRFLRFDAAARSARAPAKQSLPRAKQSYRKVEPDHRGGKFCLYCCGAHTWRVMPFGALIFTGWPLGVSL